MLRLPTYVSSRSLEDDDSTDKPVKPCDVALKSDLKRSTSNKYRNDTRGHHITKKESPPRTEFDEFDKVQVLGPAEIELLSPKQSDNDGKRDSTKNPSRSKRAPHSYPPPDTGAGRTVAPVQSPLKERRLGRSIKPEVGRGASCDKEAPDGPESRGKDSGGGQKQKPERGEGLNRSEDSDEVQELGPAEVEILSLNQSHNGGKRNSIKGPSKSKRAPRSPTNNTRSTVALVQSSLKDRGLGHSIKPKVVREASYEKEATDEQKLCNKDATSGSPKPKPKRGPKKAENLSNLSAEPRSDNTIAHCESVTTSDGYWTTAADTTKPKPQRAPGGKRAKGKRIPRVSILDLT